MPQPRTALVTGATGQQGGAVARALLARGHRVVALTRRPDSPAAAALAAAGARIAAGDLRSPDTLAAALRGSDTLYAMGTPYGPETSVEAETREGIALLDAAREAAVGHVIYSSVASADRQTGVPHFDSKAQVERHLIASGLRYTISAPVAFMDNILIPSFVEGLKQGELRMALPAARPLQQVAVADIGAFAAALVERREAVFGRRYDIAGDELTGEEAAAVLSRAIGRDTRYVAFPPAALRAYSADLAAMFEWFDRVGYAADRAALQREFPEVRWQSFAAWAGAQDWRKVLDR
jgi:uncharacterized protein YbjT (DUF2867 family)